MGLAYAFGGEETLGDHLWDRRATMRKTCLCPEMGLCRVLTGSRVRGEGQGLWPCTAPDAPGCPGSPQLLDGGVLASSSSLLDHYGAGTQGRKVDLSLIPSILQSPIAQLPPAYNFLSSMSCPWNCFPCFLSPPSSPSWRCSPYPQGHRVPVPPPGKPSLTCGS